MNHPTPLQTGTRIDDYEIEDTLWITNSGYIYRAAEIDRNRRVLLQEYLPPMLATRHWSGIHAMALNGLEDEFEAGLTQFLRDSRVLAQINDPYVCRVYEYTEANATAYMVLDYEPGQTLQDRLAGSATPLGDNEIRNLLVPLLKGLRVAHAADLLHRDINPANIYLRDVGPPILIGFGGPWIMPPDATEPHVENRIAPGYSPIEQYQTDAELGPWTDLYALGATMYRCLAGHAPPDATRRVTAIAQDQEDPLAPATELGVSDYSPGLVSAIDWMLEPVPANRPASVSAVLGPLTEDPPQTGKKPAHDPNDATPVESTGASRLERGNITTQSVGGGERHTQSKPPRRRAPPRADRTVGPPPPVIGLRERHSRYTRTPSRRRWPWIVGLGLVCVAALMALYQPPSSDVVVVGDPDRTTGNGPPHSNTKVPPANPESAETVRFDHRGDAERAQQYRDLARQSKQIQQLLAVAKEHLTRGQRLAPPGDNALADYRAILALDPNNADAQLGVSTIQTQLVTAAEEAFQAQDIDQAKHLLDQAAKVREENDQGRSLRGKIEQHLAAKAHQERVAREAAEARRNKIRALLEHANSAFQAGHLIQPPQDNALDYFRRVLHLDPEQAAARQGVERIGRDYLQRAADALARDELDQADGLLNTAAAILPGNQSVALLRDQLKTRRVIVERERRQQQRLVAERKARRQARLEQERRTRQKLATLREQLASTDQDAPESTAKASQARPATPLSKGVAAYYGGDYDISMKLLGPLAKQGQPRAQIRVAMMYYYGRGVARDVDRAELLIRTALPQIRAEVGKGTPWAQTDLGSLYADGLVLAENDKEAIHLYRLAAEQGYAGAQTNLGVMYATGEGVSRDREQAIVWLGRAAAQGDRIAQENLRTLGLE